MGKAHVLRGLATVSFYATDLEAAKQWYSTLLDIEPYFHVPGYIEFRIGDYQHELGIIDRAFAPTQQQAPAGAIAYWHVDDLQPTLDTLLSLGATLFQPMTDHSNDTGRFVTASVVDPFGNVLGIMTNVHYLDILHKKNAEVH